MTAMNNYDLVIGDYLEEKKELRRTITVAESREKEVDRIIADLRARAKRKPTITVSEALAARVQATQVGSRGDTVSAVLDAIKTFPGLTARQLAVRLDGKLRSPAKDVVKLVHSTAGYLRDRKKLVIKDGLGQWFPVHDEEGDN